MRNSKITTLALTTAIFAVGTEPSYAQSAAQQAGVAAAVRGDVTLAAVVPAQPERVVGQNLGSGDRIFLGDMIETGPNSGMQIMLLDETIFTIGPDAGLVIDEFVYDPSDNAGQVTASVVKGAFRFVSGRVAKEEPRNMNVRTPVGTIGIRGTSAAGRVSPPDANGNQTANIVLLGPGVDNNANERAGRIIVTGGGTSVEITRSGFGTIISGLNAIPTPPVRFEPAVVAALTGGLGTNGGARPGNGPNGQQGAQGQSGSGGSGSAGGSGQGGTTGGPVGGGSPIALGQANALSGQNLGAGVVNANLLGTVGAAQNEADNQVLRATEQATNFANTAVATFDQLRAIETGTATFDFGTVALTHSSGPNTNSGGSYNANISIDFSTRTIDLTVSDVTYFFNGGANQLFVFNPNAGSDINGNFSDDSGPVADSWNSTDEPDRFPTLPTDGSTATVAAVVLNNTDAGIIAANGVIAVTIDNGTDKISGGKVVAAQ